MHAGLAKLLGSSRKRVATALGRRADTGLVAVAPRVGGVLVTVRPPPPPNAESPGPAPPPAPDWWHDLYRQSILAVQWVVAQEPANEWLVEEFSRQEAAVIHAVESGVDIDTLPEKWVWQIVQRANAVHKQHGPAAYCGGLVDDVVREYERRIDNSYRGLTAFSRPPGDSAYAVLAAFDSHILSEYMIRERLPHKRLTLGPAQKLKLLGEGYIQAMRWVLGEQTAIRPTPRADDELIRSGAELIQYGTDYHQASIFYQGYSQKVYDAECDPQVARLRFVPRVEEHRRFGWGLADEAAPELELPPADRLRRNQARQRAGEVFVRVPHRLTDGRIEITDFVPLGDPRVRDGVPRNAGRPLLLPPTAELGGFTMGQFDAFCHVLHCWSACAMDLYLAYALGGTPQRRCMPTQVVSRADFIRVVSDLSRLPPRSVALILDRLTADNRTRRLDAYLQPFVCGEDSVAWSVRATLLSAPQRNLLKLMARTPAHKNLADNLIGSREGPLLDDLARWLGAKGWDTTANRPLHGPAVGEVDLLGWNWTYPDEVLVVEAKAVLQADEPNEVRAVTRELQRAQGQLGRVIRTLQDMDATARRNLYPGVDWPRVSRWYGLVVTPESEPGFGYDPATFPAASLLTLKRRLAAKAWRSPSRVWQATVSRDWQAEFRAGRVVYDSFRLAGVTFEVPLLEY